MWVFAILQAQCPDNVDDFIIVSQDDWDYYTSTYPDCNEWQLTKVNGKFIGHPKPVPYILSLSLLLAIILGFFKFLFRKS